MKKMSKFDLIKGELWSIFHGINTWIYLHKHRKEEKELMALDEKLKDRHKDGEFLKRIKEEA